MPDRPSPSATEIQAIFDRIAPVYDRLNHDLSFGLHHVWKTMTVKWCEPKPGDLALDLCCGSGDLTFILAKQVGATGKTIGLDFSPRLLDIARQRALDRPELNLDWIEGNALDLPFADNTFDCATMGYGLRNVVDIPKCLAEVHRVLKPGARAAILDFHESEEPIARLFARWYLHSIVVPTARRHGLTDEYAYISPSLDRFPTGKEQVKLGYSAGFSRAVHYPIASGMMGVLVLVK
ncbi:bifunctional demethylmenaquinone methyltransferase/2-methoxy-6-polyprenyl-1,4-benzoquinol methylase UbiE [Pannus brasiliensis CCIBt3594]|uniref:2-phytyl-1,4-naphtoquinone methyltransferase n=1 Tax=Pannus brasiliensis CCIBt3594 TaxID=1427578 RepID=A0AAW9QU84_9CHRO